MTRKTKKGRRELTNTQLLSDAWDQLQDKPRAVTGRATSDRSPVFSARYRGLCGRCGRWIDRGDDVRFQKDFVGVVHSGCRPPKVTVTFMPRPTAPPGKREQDTTPCPECHLVHAGDCW
jgi:hypothetical protein